ncbi:PspC domain-containing protein [Corynebacterium stationis]|uniref:PspC domain-containing protein n=1 Tax=Corynebacterium stationis TaxID=1705 RepID=UPI003413D338
MLGGVCSGIDDLRGSDPNVIRFWVVLPMVFGVPMVAVYLWVWLTIPEKSEVI